MIRKVIGVMGSGDEAFDELSQTVGQAVANAGCHLLTGAGKGVMTAVTRAFVGTEGRTGLSIGVVRAKEEPILKNGKREWKPRVKIPDVVELPILTHLPLSGPDGKDTKSRNHINVLTSAAVIVLPGKEGTRTELELALEYGRPTLLYLRKHAVDGHSAADLLKKHGSELLTVATDASQLKAWLKRFG